MILIRNIKIINYIYIEEEEEEEEEENLVLFMKRIINFQHVISYKGVLLKIDWWIISLLLVSGLHEDGPG